MILYGQETSCLPDFFVCHGQIFFVSQEQRTLVCQGQHSVSQEQETLCVAWNRRLWSAKDNILSARIRKPYAWHSVFSGTVDVWPPGMNISFARNREHSFWQDIRDIWLVKRQRFCCQPGSVAILSGREKEMSSLPCLSARNSGHSVWFGTGDVYCSLPKTIILFARTENILSGSEQETYTVACPRQSFCLPELRTFCLASNRSRIVRRGQIFCLPSKENIPSNQEQERSGLQRTKILCAVNQKQRTFCMERNRRCIVSQE